MRNVLRALERHKLLLAADRVLPSVATIIAGEPVRGSWWAHPRSHAIFGALSALSRDPDVLTLPLVAGKVTFVHRDLWAALFTIARARERWQTAGLPPAVRRLLNRLQRAGELEASGDPVREIERRLLARSQEIHTERGSHAKRLEQWERWAARMDVSPLRDVAEAKEILERAVADLGGGNARRTLPWWPARR